MADKCVLENHRLTGYPNFWCGNGPHYYVVGVENPYGVTAAMKDCFLSTTIVVHECPLSEGVKATNERSLDAPLLSGVRISVDILYAYLTVITVYLLFLCATFVYDTVPCSKDYVSSLCPLLNAAASPGSSLLIATRNKQREGRRNEEIRYVSTFLSRGGSAQHSPPAILLFLRLVPLHALEARRLFRLLELLDADAQLFGPCLVDAIGVKGRDFCSAGVVPLASSP